MADANPSSQARIAGKPTKQWGRGAGKVVGTCKTIEANMLRISKDIFL